MNTLRLSSVIIVAIFFCSAAARAEPQAAGAESVSDSDQAAASQKEAAERAIRAYNESMKKWMPNPIDAGKLNDSCPAARTVLCRPPEASSSHAPAAGDASEAEARPEYDDETASRSSDLASSASELQPNDARDVLPDPAPDTVQGYPYDMSRAALEGAGSPDAARRSLERGGMNWQRGQQIADRLEDAIHPGFGRFEWKTKHGGKGRIDYIAPQHCRTRGPGICLNITF